MSNPPRPRRGYVLLMTLVLLVLAGFLLTSVARRSLRIALDALELEEEVQRRWAAYSCRQALLPRFEQILASSHAASEGGEAQPAAYAPLVAQIALANQRVTLLLADENAKINLNVVRRVRGRGEMRRLVRSLASDRRLPPLRLPPAGDHDAGLRFHSWGQVFAMEQARPGTDVPSALLRATTDLTCWGSGKLDPQRASDLTVEHLCGAVIGRRDVDRLLELRRKHPKHTAEQLVQGLALRGSAAERLSELVGEGASCHSLWLVIAGERCTHYELCVLESQRPAEADLAAGDRAATSREREKNETVTYHFRW